MSTTGPMRHIEEWVFTITRDETDTWPDCLVPYSGMPTTPKFRPTAVGVKLTRDARTVDLTVTGWRLKNNGKPGGQQVTARWHDIDRIGDINWLAEVVDHWRRVLGLGPGSTGVDWT